jgi:hypothetical protein
MRKLIGFEDLNFFCPPECHGQIVIRSYAAYWPLVFALHDDQSYPLTDPRRITYWVTLCDRPRRLWCWGPKDEGWEFESDDWERVSPRQIDALLRWARNYSKPVPPRSLMRKILERLGWG